jgi:hypothetical protein
VSVRVAAAPVSLVDHARAERPGLDQLQRAVFGDRRQERRAATDDDRIAEYAQLVDEADLDRCRGQAGAADRDVIADRMAMTDAWSRTRSHPVLQMGDPGSLDGSHLLELRLGVPQVVKEALTVAEQHRYHVELELVEQPPAMYC